MTDTAVTPVIDLLATKYRTKREFLKGFTGLHPVVVTLRCNQRAGCGNHHQKNGHIYMRGKVNMPRAPQYSWRIRANRLPVASFSARRSWNWVPDGVCLSIMRLMGPHGERWGRPPRKTVMGTPIGASPELQPGQGEPILNDCSRGSPVGEVVQDDKTNFWTYWPPRKLFQNAAPGYKPG